MSSKPYVSEFLSFLEASPSPYHAVSTVKKLLSFAGFIELSERDAWDSKIKCCGRYFLTRNGSSIIAFVVGGKWKAGNGISMVAAHTDSPTLRIKPNSKKSSAGYLQVGVETYGGGTWHTWFDRDLSVAGRVFTKESDSTKIIPRLLKIEKPILRIPNLAIHLNSGTANKFEFNNETQLYPVLGLVEEQLNKTDKDESQTIQTNPLASVAERHHSTFIDLVAKELNVPVSSILDFELVLYDTNKPTSGGINDEFIFSARLDNLCSSYTAIQALINSVEKDSSYINDDSIRLVSLFDHEEVGSNSAQGAASNLLEAVIKRLSVLNPGSPLNENLSLTLQSHARSFLISADMAHAVHPNYEAKYETNHKPAMNKGPVIKVNANQRYTTNSYGVILLQETANAVSVPLQLFTVRNDSSCGSTIGPILSSRLGIKTVDIGNPQLAMHSIRETCGTTDLEYSVKLFEQFFNDFSKLEARIMTEGY